MFKYDKRTARRIAASLADYAQAMSTIGSLLAGLKGQPSWLNILGLGAAVTGLIAQKLKANGLEKMSEKWATVRVTSVDAESWLEPFACDDEGEWRAYTFRSHNLVRHKASKEWARVEGDPELFLHDLADLVWSSCGGFVQTQSIKGMYDVLQLIPGIPEPSFPSARADAIWARLEPFADEARSLLLDGPPGTGKSTIVRNLTERVGGRVLRIPVSEVDSLSPTGLTSIVTLLRPEVIVIDDFDRAWGQSRLLDFFEQSRASFKLLIVTTNSLESVDPAVTRPGRFDEVVSFDRLGDDVVAELLGPTWIALGESEREKVLAWPIAYLVELRKRHLRLKVDLPKEVAELDGRVHRRKVPEWAKFLAQPGVAQALTATPG